MCVYHQEGSFPLRSHVLHEGVRFPLGVASAGLAILSHLPTAEISSYLDQAALTKTWGTSHSAESITERTAYTQYDGYATNPGLLVEGSWGLGAAVFDRMGRPAWALSLTGVETRFASPVRRKHMGAMLLEQAQVLSLRLRQIGSKAP